MSFVNSLKVVAGGAVGAIIGIQIAFWSARLVCGH
jgi:hypothetical protein